MKQTQSELLFLVKIVKKIDKQYYCALLDRLDVEIKVRHPLKHQIIPSERTGF